MFRGDRPVGTVSNDGSDREGRAPSREQGRQQREPPSQSSSGQDPGPPAQRGRVARTDEERIEELESTVQQLRAELIRRENEQQSVVDRYEALLRDRGSSGSAGSTGRDSDDPRTGAGRDAEPWTGARLREAVRALLPW
jgi:hypothetical protein